MNPLPKSSNQVDSAPTTANAQPPAENPLDKLRDIHLPDPIDSFPYAPGWWILLALVLIVIGYIIYRKIKYRQAIRLLIPARAELAQLRALSVEAINSQAIVTLSALLKRVCLVYFKPSQVAALNGASWLAFLNQQFENHQKQSNNQAIFDQKAIQFFSQAAYQKSASIDQSDWMHLLDASEQCIEAIVKQAAKKQLSGSNHKKPHQAQLGGGQ